MASHKRIGNWIWRDAARIVEQAMEVSESPADQRQANQAATATLPQIDVTEFAAGSATIDGDGVARILAAIAQQQQTPKLKRGGQRKYDSKLKKRIRDAWATGRYKRLADLDGLVGIVGVTAKMVHDADRKKPRSTE